MIAVFESVPVSKSFGATDTCGKKGFGYDELTGYFRVVDKAPLRGRSVESRRTHLHGSRGA